MIGGAVDDKIACLYIINRRGLICAVNQDAEELFKKTVEVDRLIDMLKNSNDMEVSKWCFTVFQLTLFHHHDGGGGQWQTQRGGGGQDF